MSAGKVRVQRAWACWDADEPRTCQYVLHDPQPNIAADEYPVLVLPEAAVSECKHKERIRPQGDMFQACLACGAIRRRPIGVGHAWGEWQLPRLLRVAKERTK